MWPIVCKEFRDYLGSLTAYLCLGAFLLLMGLWVWVMPGINVLDGQYAELTLFFDASPYLFIVLLPALTMRSLAEERKLGTLELLLTSPLTPMQLILGKYIAVLGLVLLTLLLTTSYVVSLYWLGHPPGNLDLAAIAGSYLGLFLLTALFAAVGLLSSSLTDSQVVAFVLGVLLCLGLYQFGSLWSQLQLWKSYALLVAQLGAAYHYAVLGKGVIDTRSVLYLVSLSIALLALTRVCLMRER